MVKNQVEIKAVFQSQEHDLGIYSGKKLMARKNVGLPWTGLQFCFTHILGHTRASKKQVEEKVPKNTWTLEM